MSTDAASKSPSGLPVRKVDVTHETRRFWDATAEEHLLLKRCNDCETVIWYPRAHCPACSSLNTDWFESNGRGSVYSFSINRKGDGAWAPVSPYVVAYVELDEGPRVLTNIVGCDVADVHVDMRVRVTWDDTGEGMAIYRFAPESA